MKVYVGKIGKLEENQVFCFGSNTEGRHGAGAAAFAKKHCGAIYGQSEGLQGQSWGIITKDLNVGMRSRTPEQIQEQIQKLYEYATSHPNMEFLIAYTADGFNLNGYTNEEMASFFRSVTIPSNIVFEEEFYKLVSK